MGYHVTLWLLFAAHSCDQSTLLFPPALCAWVFLSLETMTGDTNHADLSRDMPGTI